MRTTLGELRKVLAEAFGRPDGKCAVIMYSTYGEESIYIFSSEQAAEAFANGETGDESADTMLDVNQGEEDSDESTARKFADMASFLRDHNVVTVWDMESEEGGPMSGEAYIADLDRSVESLRSSGQM